MGEGGERSETDEGDEMKVTFPSCPSSIGVADTFSPREKALVRANIADKVSGMRYTWQTKPCNPLRQPTAATSPKVRGLLEILLYMAYLYFNSCHSVSYFEASHFG